MSASPLNRVRFAGAATLAEIPRSAGVGQILGGEGRSLLIGRPANLRRWFATQLGAGRPRRKGARPPTDLSAVAAALGYAETSSSFRQRLVFERLMGEQVPLGARRDLKTPAYLRLDLAERFPRLSVRLAGEGPLFGPFRDRRAAARALEALHRRVPLRPCDYSFEPDPALPLGLGCLYAQVRSCAAPCLARVAEAGYRELAQQAAELLDEPGGRGEELARSIPAWVSSARDGLVVERGRSGIELYPVSAGAVAEQAAVTCSVEELDDAVHSLSWPSLGGRDDRPWLCAWLYGPRKSGGYLPVSDPGDRDALAVRVRSWLSG